jgi:heavy metal efflux system protein
MNAIMAFSVRMRALMVAFFVLVMIAGGVAFTRLNIEAYPDPIPPLVDIVTQNPGQSAEEIERYITIPIEIGVATAPYLSAMRSISLFGLSDVKLQFTYDLTYEEGGAEGAESTEPAAAAAEPGAANHLALEPDRRNLRWARLKCC